HELDVVDEENVVLAIALVQRELCPRLNRSDEVVQERLGGDVEDFSARVVLLNVVPDGVQEVGLSETGVPVYRQWIVGTTRGFSDRLCGGECEPVRRTGDERVKCHPRIEPSGSIDARSEGCCARRDIRLLVR